MVGVITHVEAMKERLHPGIVVKRRADGRAPSSPSIPSPPEEETFLGAKDRPVAPAGAALCAHAITRRAEGQAESRESGEVEAQPWDSTND